MNFKIREACNKCHLPKADAQSDELRSGTTLNLYLRIYSLARFTIENSCPPVPLVMPCLFLGPGRTIKTDPSKWGVKEPVMVPQLCVLVPHDKVHTGGNYIPRVPCVSCWWSVFHI